MSIRYFRLWITTTILSLCIAVSLQAQEVILSPNNPETANVDTSENVVEKVVIEKDTTITTNGKNNKRQLLQSRREEFFTPKKKAMFSVVVPGLGQIYNKEYWKLPIVYGGVGVAGYFYFYNYNEYNYYRKLYAGRLSNDPAALATKPEIPNENIKLLMDSYRQDLDLTVLLSVVGYGLQVMDALVFAHLKNFDISDDISLRFKPLALPHNTIGFGLVMNF